MFLGLSFLTSKMGITRGLIQCGLIETTHDTSRTGSRTQKHFNISYYDGDGAIDLFCLRLGLQHVSLSQKAGIVTSTQVGCHNLYQELP